MNKNYWISFSDESFATWEIEIPFSNIENLLRFSRSVLELEFVKLLNDNQNTSFLNELEKYIETNNLIFLFDVSHLNRTLSENYWRHVVNIFYFDSDGSMKSKRVSQLSSILMDELKLSHQYARYASSDPPVIFRSPLFDINNIPKVLNFSIQLRTNLYFPQITKYYNWSEDISDSVFFKTSNTIDNTELAIYNTEILNSWIADIKVLVKDIGGSFKVGEDSFGVQDPWNKVTEDRIVI